MRYALAIALTLTLMGCAKTMGTVETNTAACAVWQPVRWSVKDTDLTIAQVKVQNARRDAYCR